MMMKFSSLSLLWLPTKWLPTKHFFMGVTSHFCRVEKCEFSESITTYSTHPTWILHFVYSSSIIFSFLENWLRKTYGNQPGCGRADRRARWDRGSVWHELGPLSSNTGRLPSSTSGQTYLISRPKVGATCRPQLCFVGPNFSAWPHIVSSNCCRDHWNQRENFEAQREMC